MKHISSIEWIKRLTIILLICIIGYIIIKLTPVFHPFFMILKIILYPVFISLVITYLLHPIVEFLHRKGLPRTLAILIIYIIFFGGVGIGIIKGAPYLLQQFKDFSAQIPKLNHFYEENINRVYHVTPEAFHRHFNGLLLSVERWANGITESVIGSLKGFFQSFFVIVTIPLLVFYFLKDITKIKKGLWELTPTRWRDSGRAIMHEIDISLGNYIRGQLYVALLLACLGSLGLWVIKVPYPLLLGIFIGITDIIPYFGPIIGAVPALLIASTVSIKAAIFVIVLIFVLQFLEGNIIGPLIVGKTAAIHPVYIMLSLLVGGEIAGILGLLLAVPAFVVLRILVTHLYLGVNEHKVPTYKDK